MSIKVKCEDCSMAHLVEDEDAGKRITCWGCGQTLFVDAIVASRSSGTSASIQSLIGKPLPERAQNSTGHSLPQRALGLIAAIVSALAVGVIIFRLANAARQNLIVPRDLGEWFLWFFLLFVLAIVLGLTWLLCFTVYCRIFKPVATVSDLRAELGEPSYSADSLICMDGNPGRITAIIVDDQAGLIHFRRSFLPANFWTIKTLPWFSCPLKSMTSVRQWSHKGTTTLTIYTDAGKGIISSDASGFGGLQQRFPET